MDLGRDKYDILFMFLPNRALCKTVTASFRLSEIGLNSKTKLKPR
jgi:hypothetical protein